MQDQPTPLGTLIRSRRQQLGLGLRELEALTGVDRGRLSHVEAGRRSFEPDALAALSRALQLPLSDLYVAAGYPIPRHLPSIRAYLRRAYSMPEAAVDEIERYLVEHSPGFSPGVGPTDGEDEEQEP